MNLPKMIAELRTAREQVEQTIMVLESMAEGQGKRRGRRPLWMTNTRQGIFDGAREATSEGMKRYWATKRKKTTAAKKK